MLLFGQFLADPAPERKTGGSIKAKCGNIVPIECTELFVTGPIKSLDKRTFNSFIKIM